MNLRKCAWAVILVPLVMIKCTNVDKNHYLFNRIDVKHTSLDFINKINPFDSSNIIQYLYAFNGSGVAIGDINNDNLPDIYFGANQGENKLFLNLGNLKFKDITESAGVGGTGDWSTGVSMVDINADGFLDIYVCQIGGYKNFKGRNLLYINNGDLSYTEMAEKYELDHIGLSTQATFLDYDLDGDLDIYLLSHSVRSQENYSDVTLRQKADPISGDRFFRNDIDHFTDVTNESKIYSSKLGFGLGIGVSDFNNDGYPDIYVGNDFFENDYLYLNQKDGTFIEVIEEAVACNSKFSMGIDISDINNDGHVDLFSLDMKPDNEQVLKKSETPESSSIYQYKLGFGYHHQYARNVFQLFQNMDANTEVPRYSEIAQFSGIDATDWSWSALFADYNCDGFNDLFITNGILHRPNDMDYLNFISNEMVQQNEPDSILIQKMPDGKSRNYFFGNNGDLTFDNKSDKWIQNVESYSNGAAYADLDNDGDVDLIVNNINENAFLLENKSDEELEFHYVKIKLKGSKSNPFAIGSRLTLYIGKTIYYRELYPVRGFMSSVDYVLHFGLGDHEKIDSLVIIWPDGSKQAEATIQINSLNSINFSPNRGKSPKTTKQQTIFSDISEKTKFQFSHLENLFIDEEIEPLIPYYFSKEGPALAVGDVNGDGLDDVFIGGAYGQNGIVLVQTLSGGFESNQEEFWTKSSKYEDVDAAFFDVDNDGDLDLYVASGGNHLQGSSPYYADRLYINDGSGNFKLDLSFFETNMINSSCVAVGDLSGDGVEDVFVGARNVPGNYGLLPSSKLWINGGNGKLYQTKEFPAIKGMVSDALIEDLNGDGLNDLVVAGHWMPITIYWNKSNRYEKEELKDSKGLWNTIKIADLDNDGYKDIVAGNLGLNSYLKVSPKFPLKMYTNDFDKNGTIESIICHFKEGVEYPIYHKDQMVKQINSLKKRFVDYEKYSISPMDEIFATESLRNSQKLEINELRSSIFYGGAEGYKKKILPNSAQFSPIRAIETVDINDDGKMDIIAMGNSDDFVPMIGRMASNFGFLGISEEDRKVRSINSHESGLSINEVCTSIHSFAGIGTDTRFILGINNGRPRILAINKEVAKNE